MIPLFVLYNYYKKMLPIWEKKTPSTSSQGSLRMGELF